VSVFSIVIPAYNEEDAVQDILRRSLKAAENIKSSDLGITEVEVILVSDGSYDRTAPLAREIAGAQVIAYEKNRGYGAAIMTGFAAAKGEWLGFIDSDGTCDPEMFQELIRLGQQDKLDVILGSRMHPNSKMPAVRRLGNLIFRSIVNFIAGASVTDIASGMRVIRRAALDRLAPLPTGLHYTPAMSVRAILDPQLNIGETPMPYEERVGRSKLSVIQDGLRFLEIILKTAMTYRPFTFFGSGSAALVAVAAVFLFAQMGAPTAAPVPFYLQHGYIADWMFFRILLVAVLLSSAVFGLSLGAVAQQLVGVINHEEEIRGGLVGRFVAGFPVWGILSLAVAFWVVRRPLSSYLTQGVIPMNYWIFPVVAALFVLIGLQFLAFYGVAEIAHLLYDRERYRTKGED
jgi:hypothetical protein